MESALEALNLSKRYGEVVAVDDIGFKVKGGELFGFLGPNAAGKTTTIRLLTGVVKADTGTASILGYDVEREGIQARQRIGIVPEMANAYVDLSAWNNVMLVAKLCGISKRIRHKRGGHLLEEFGLYERKEQLVRGFSKGMKQKLLLCMALINEPQVLFLDEPTSGLDVESQRLIRNKILQINKEGTTIFLTTHNMEEANQLCERIAIINHGKLAAIDTPESLRSHSSELRLIEVSFEKPIRIKDLLNIQGVKDVKKMGDKIRVSADERSVVLEGLIDYSRSNGIKMVSLNTLAPTLEDVFLKLVKES